MIELEYPFERELILRKKKSLKRKLLERKNINYTNKNIAVLGGSTSSEIVKILELFLLNEGIKPTFYESQYNKFYEEAVFENKKLEAFKPDIIYIFTSIRNIVDFPKINDSIKEIENKFENEIGKYYDIWSSLEKRYNCPIIQNNFELPSIRLFGNKDASIRFGRINFINRLNLEINSYAQKNDNFYICDINYISADYGLSKWFDEGVWYMYKYGFDINGIPELSFNLSNIIKSIFGKNKKGLVLDLDNTLWGGIIGDDGIDNIIIGPEDPVGQAYLDFQNYIKDLKDLGVLLNINSKNEEENAFLGLNHRECVLKKDDFISIKVNWKEKDENFIDIASELNFMPDSLVFIDDNPAERNIVRENIMGVNAPEISSITDYIRILDRSGFFEVTLFSKDDVKRNDMYRENIKRNKLGLKFKNYDEYLQSLEMKAFIKPFNERYMGRITQLTNKTNQFNLTTYRYSQLEIEKLANDDKCITLYGKLEDKFGDNGVVSLIIGEVKSDICYVNLWLMSCRVFKRNMELAMMDKLVSECKKRGIKKIQGHYIPTSKNKFVRDFYEEIGFENIDKLSNGETFWEFIIDGNYKNKNTIINVN